MRRKDCRFIAYLLLVLFSIPHLYAEEQIQPLKVIDLKADYEKDPIGIDFLPQLRSEERR